jgi:hypothetical protein
MIVSRAVNAEKRTLQGRFRKVLDRPIVAVIRQLEASSRVDDNYLESTGVFFFGPTLLMVLQMSHFTSFPRAFFRLQRIRI